MSELCKLVPRLAKYHKLREPQRKTVNALIDSNNSDIEKLYQEVQSLMNVNSKSISEIARLVQVSQPDNVTIPKVAPSTPHRRDDSLLVRDTSVNIIISDSMTRDVKENSVDPSGRTQVKSFGGLDSLQICNKVGAFKRNSQISEAILHVGANDKVNPLTEGNIQSLIKTTREKFPSANITCTAVLPMKEGMSSNAVKFNNTLSDVCKGEGVELKDFGPDFAGKPDLFNKDKIHLSEAGSEIFTGKLKAVLVERGAVEMLVNKPMRIETVVTDRDNSDGRESQDGVSVPYIVTKLVHATGGNEFQAFAARCSSHDQAMEIRHKIQEDTKWKYAPEGPLSCLSWAYSVNGVFRKENDGESGAGPRIRKCMETIGMDNCIIAIARKGGEHIQSRRWSIMQDLITEAAGKLGYSVPSSLNIHSMFREYGQKRQFRYRKGPRFNNDQGDGSDQANPYYRSGQDYSLGNYEQDSQYTDQNGGSYQPNSQYRSGQNYQGSYRQDSQYASGQGRSHQDSRQIHQDPRQGYSKFTTGHGNSQFRTGKEHSMSHGGKIGYPQHHPVNTPQTQSQAQVQCVGNDYMYYLYPGASSGYPVNPTANPFMQVNHQNAVPDIRMHNWSPVDHNLRQGQF